MAPIFSFRHHHFANKHNTEHTTLVLPLDGMELLHPLPSSFRVTGGYVVRNVYGGRILGGQLLSNNGGCIDQYRHEWRDVCEGRDICDRERMKCWTLPYCGAMRSVVNQLKGFELSWWRAALIVKRCDLL